MANATTRIIHLDMGQVRRREQNCHTAFHGVAPAVCLELPFEALFVAHYRSIRELARREARGIGLVVVHAPTGALAARLWLAAKDDIPSVAILGRHSVCDLVLEDEVISLRHLALVSAPGGDGRFSLHDLRSIIGLRSAVGRRIDGALVEGAGLFGLGPYALVAFGTGEERRWPELATEAWRQLSGDTAPLQAEMVPRAGVGYLGRRARGVSEIRGPLQTTERLLLPDEPSRGHLLVSSDTGTVRIAVGAAALERGVLFGRYPRCDSAGVLTSGQLSRVHLLVRELDGAVYGFDTASTNGVFRDPEAIHEASVLALSRGEVAVLGDASASVRFVSDDS